MSETHYIRVEGVNMTPFVLDTEDLSTIRGGGLLLLDAIHEVEQKFASEGLKVLSSGASVGLFKYQGDPDQVGRLVDDLRAEFDQDARWRHATILVDSVPARPGEFLDDRERLIARIRRRQLAAPSLAIPGQAGQMVNGSASDDAPESSAVCGIDQVRPAEGTPKKIKGQTRPLSAATRARRDYGVANKDSFYGKVLERDLKGQTGEESALLGLPDTMRFARHFQDIAGGGGWGPLNDKMAVLYLDGNGFSGIQQDLINAACEGKSGDELDEAAIEAQKKFDKTLKDYRAQFLRTLLEKATTDTDGAWKNGNDRARKDLDGDESADTLTGRIRLETLLWGGDEIMMVMPAWQGWAVARLFLEESKDWAIEGHPLHHALGLVFCNHKAPIHRITKLARDLADHAKDVVGRDGSSLAYQVLESFDHLGAGPEAHFNGLRLNGASSVRTLMLTAEAVNALDTHLPTLRGDGGLPQRQLKRLVRALFVHRDQDQAKETFKTLAIDRHAKEALDSVLATLSGAPSDPQSGGASAQGHGTSDHWHAWYHLEQLWDYVKPQRAKPADEEAEA